MSAPLHRSAALQHGAAYLPGVAVLSYSAELRDDRAELVGDRANDQALRAVLERWRSSLRIWGADPFDDAPAAALNKERLDRELKSGSTGVKALLLKVAEEFSERLVRVMHEFRRLPQWGQVERIVIGGGFSGSQFGRDVIQRAARESTCAGGPDLRAISRPPDHAGLLGAFHLLADPPRPRDAMLAVDIGGTKLRAGLLGVADGPEGVPTSLQVLDCRVWRHRDQALSRDAFVEHLIEFLDELATDAVERNLRLRPIIGIGCPGVIDANGHIARGAQNLPGDWEDPGFNLADRICGAMARRGREIRVVVHNDAVMQGLSEMASMRDVSHWGIFTIGTGLGNACFAWR